MTEYFHDQNREIAKAINFDLCEGLAVVAVDSKRAAARGTMEFANFMHRIGAIAKAPAGW